MDKLYTAVGRRVALVIAGFTAPSIRREEGQTLVEYALIIGLIAVALTTALIFLQGQIANMFTTIGNAL